MWVTTLYLIRILMSVGKEVVEIIMRVVSCEIIQNHFVRKSSLI